MTAAQATMLEPKAQRSPAARRAVAVVLAAGACLAVGVVTGTQLYLADAIGRVPATLAEQILAQTLAAAAWLPVGAAIVLLARRLPLGAATWRRHLPMHLAAAAATSFVVNLVITSLWWAARLPLADGFWGTTIQKSLVYFHINALLYWLIVGAAHAGAYHRASRERELHAARLEAQLARARLNALRAQLHPHFLFNALHTVGLLWRTSRAEEAYDTLERLGAILRRMLDGSNEQEVPLAEELDFARQYLEIERTRLRDRLRVRIDVTPEALGARVPSLLLQPLVENAVRYGIAPRSRGGVVDVRGWRDGDVLRVAVRDDGPGFPLSDTDTAVRARDGVGLRNTRERLRQLYGDRQRLIIGNAPGGGCVVHVELPWLPPDVAS